MRKIVKSFQKEKKSRARRKPGLSNFNSVTAGKYNPVFSLLLLMKAPVPQFIPIDYYSGPHLQTIFSRGDANSSKFFASLLPTLYFFLRLSPRGPCPRCGRRGAAALSNPTAGIRLILEDEAIFLALWLRVCIRMLGPINLTKVKISISIFIPLSLSTEQQAKIQKK